ncbi:Hypothetical protein POVR1_LOCUS499 [uncultured virus]|nr:Hypothetical protein POVR1_LOCUS499 [uncultured virus]
MACEVDNQGRVLDAITYMPIPQELIVRVKSGETLYCFNIDTIYRSMAKLHTNVAIDPFTRKPFPPEITTQAQEYGARRAITVRYEDLSFQVDYFAPIGDVIVQIVKTLQNLDVAYELVIDNQVIKVVAMNFDDEIIKFSINGSIEFFKTNEDLAEFHEKLFDYTNRRMSIFHDPPHLVNEMLKVHLGMISEETDEEELSEDYISLRGVQLFRDVSDDDLLADTNEVSDSAAINIYKVFGLLPKKVDLHHAEDFWVIFDDPNLTNHIVNEKIKGLSSEIQSIYRTVIALSPSNRFYKEEYSHFLVVLLNKLIPVISSHDYHEMMILRYHIIPPTYRLIDEIIQSHFQSDMLDSTNTLEINYSDFWELEYPIDPQNLMTWKEGTLNQSPGVLVTLRTMIRNHINSSQYAALKDILLQRKDFNILLKHGKIRLP